MGTNGASHKYSSDLRLSSSEPVKRPDEVYGAQTRHVATRPAAILSSRPDTKTLDPGWDQTHLPGLSLFLGWDINAPQLECWHYSRCEKECFGCSSSGCQRVIPSTCFLWHMFSGSRVSKFSRLFQGKTEFIQYTNIHFIIRRRTAIAVKIRSSSYHQECSPGTTIRKESWETGTIILTFQQTRLILGFCLFFSLTSCLSQADLLLHYSSQYNDTQIRKSGDGFGWTFYHDATIYHGLDGIEERRLSPNVYIEI